MPSVTFDKFDGGLLLARPSSVSPANSLANLFNIDVQPGGWLRSRASWRRAVLNESGSLGVLALDSRVHGLDSNGGYLWAFALTQSDTPNGFTSGNSNGRLYALDNALGDYMAIGYFGTGASGNSGRLAGVTPWQTGFVTVMRDETAGAWKKAVFTVPGGLGGAYSSVTRQDIADANMPNSGLMVTIQSRIYAISDDGQNVRFCKVGDPTDWTTAGNAGFLPVSQHFGAGQRAYGLGVYQGKLAVFTDRSVQLWTVDPDPTAMAIDNVVDGIGTRHHGSIVSLNGDLLFLSDTGVRSLTTLQNSLFPSDVDVGLPVAQIAQPSTLVGGTATLPAYSTVLAVSALPFKQYWVAAPNDWTFGSADEYGWLSWSYSRQAKLNAWSWHGAGGTPRAKVKGWASLGNRMFMRTDKEPYLLVMTPEVFLTDQTEGASTALCAMTTQWLDFGKPGRRKAIYGIDFDGKNVASISIKSSAGGNRSGQGLGSLQVGDAQGGWTYSGEMLPFEGDGTEFQVSFSGGVTGELQINRFTIHYEDIQG
jgi:hypothetical protein